MKWNEKKVLKHYARWKEVKEMKWKEEVTNKRNKIYRDIRRSFIQCLTSSHRTTKKETKQKQKK